MPSPAVSCWHRDVLAAGGDRGPAVTRMSGWRAAKCPPASPAGAGLVLDRKKMQMQDPNRARTCLACQMTDPPPFMTCHLGRDHRVGLVAGCPACGRPTAACARHPCSVMRGPGGRGHRDGAAIAGGAAQGALAGGNTAPAVSSVPAGLDRRTDE